MTASIATATRNLVPRGLPLRKGRLRGFTLVELLAVVAMVGILAAIATVGYRRYLKAARSGDAVSIVASIRIAQESHRAETQGYLSCSPNLTAWYPGVPGFPKAGARRHWVQTAHGQWGCWSQLNVVTDSPTTYGFAVVAGVAGGVPPVPNSAKAPVWPNPTREPWYVIQAGGDADADGEFAYLVSSSFSGEIYVENESE